MCNGLVVTNEFYPIGCCYLKTKPSWGLDTKETGMAPFVNRIIGQTFKKGCDSCVGTEPSPLGYQLLQEWDSPGNDIPGACGYTLDACFQLCEDRQTGAGSRCVGFSFNFQDQCCYLKKSLGPYTLKPWGGRNFGLTYARGSVSLTPLHDCHPCSPF